MKQTLSIMLCLICQFSFSQTSQEAKKELKKTNSTEDITSLMKKWPGWDVELDYINMTDSSITDENIKSLEKGDVKLVNKGETDYLYKVIEVEKSKEFRVSYIYLDGSKLSQAKIDSLRAMLINKYKSGISFSELNSQYTMDGNKNGGDLGWFQSGTMVREFENAIVKHKEGDIFTVDVDSKGWYYVALKTHADKENKMLTVIKIKVYDNHR